MSKVYPPKNPCFKCERRQMGCHANCDDYNGWKAQGVEEPRNGYQSKSAERNLRLKAKEKARRGRV